MSETPSFTLQQLRIFRAIALGPSLTQAAKDLGITQPSLSQHLAKLEERVGSRLFDRRGNQLTLSDVGSYLLERTELLLAEADETEARLAEFSDGVRGRIAIAVLPSLARTIMPPALAEISHGFPDLELDLHELAPMEAVDQLYGRNVQMAILSSNALAENRLSFAQQHLCDDPYLLAVPADINLIDIQDPAKELPPSALRILRRTVHFDFGSHHNQRIEELYRRLIPGHRVTARCRSYDTALSMVEAGQGVAIAPQLAIEHGGRRIFNVRAYELPIQPRRLSVFVASQYLRVRVFKTLIEVLSQVGAAVQRGPISPAPPFALQRLGAAPLAAAGGR